MEDVPNKFIKVLRVLDHKDLSYKERLRGFDLFTLEKWMHGGLLSCFIEGGYWEGGARFLTAVHGRKMKEYRPQQKDERKQNKIQKREVHTGYKENFLHHEGWSGIGTDCPERLQFPSWEGFKTWWDNALSNLVWPQHWPYFEQEVGLQTSLDPFQPELFSEYMERRKH